jgi:RNA polymerase sigma-70 factor, ECF subfamily
MSEISLHFEQLFKTQFKLLCNISNNIIKNERAAEDIVQEVFLKLWQKKDELTIHTNYMGYLYRATANASIDYLKNNKNVIPLKQVVYNQKANDENAETAMVSKELEKSIERALRLLPPKCKAIFVLSRYEGMKYKEIATHLGISVKTVENQMGIALEKMRTELKPYLTKEFLASVAKRGISLLFLQLLYDLMAN